MFGKKKEENKTETAQDLELNLEPKKEVFAPEKQMENFLDQNKNPETKPIAPTLNLQPNTNKPEQTSTNIVAAKQEAQPILNKENAVATPQKPEQTIPTPQNKEVEKIPTTNKTIQAEKKEAPKDLFNTEEQIKIKEEVLNNIDLDKIDLSDLLDMPEENIPDITGQKTTKIEEVPQEDEFTLEPLVAGKEEKIDLNFKQKTTTETQDKQITPIAPQENKPEVKNTTEQIVPPQEINTENKSETQNTTEINTENEAEKELQSLKLESNLTLDNLITILSEVGLESNLEETLNNKESTEEEKLTAKDLIKIKEIFIKYNLETPPPKEDYDDEDNIREIVEEVMDEKLEQWTQNRLIPLMKELLEKK